MKFSLLFLLLIGLSFVKASAQIEFVSPPGDTSVCAGDTAVFEVFATPVPDSILWQYASFPNGPWLPLTDSVEGEKTSRLRVLNSGFYDGKRFRAIAFMADQLSDSSVAALLMEIDLPMPMIDPVSFCMGDSATLDAGAEYDDYLWSTGEITQTIYTTGPEHSVTVTKDGCQGEDISNVEVFENPSPTIGPSVKEFCHDDSLELFVNGSFINYHWSNDEDTQTIIVDTPGNYSVTVTNSSNCVGSTVAFVIENANPISDYITNPSIEDPQTVGREIIFIDNATPIESQINKWEWSFSEDASVLDTIYDFADNSTGVKFQTAGIKNVCLKVTNQKGCLHEECKEVTITNSPPPVVILDEISGALCLGDTILIRATATFSADPNFALRRYLIWSYGSEVTLVDTQELSYIDNHLVVNAYFVFTTNGNSIVSVTAIKYEKNDPSNEEEGSEEIDIESGSLTPTIQNIDDIPEFLCADESSQITLIIEPDEDGVMRYSINGGLIMPAIINKGIATFEILAESQLSEIVLKIHSIDLENGCETSGNGDEISIEVRQKPEVTIIGPNLVCVDEVAMLTASGANAYQYELNGNVIGSMNNQLINTQEPGNFTYFLTGTTRECSTIKSFNVDVAEPPKPVIVGDTLACVGQVIEYKSNTGIPFHTWRATSGIILGSSNDSIVLVEWQSSGTIELIQSISKCKDSISYLVQVTGDNSPPYHDLEYLSGGGILLYPNPELVQNLCYQWYKDGIVIPGEIFQGIVVGDQTDIELVRYHVEVTFCAQGGDCAQLIRYRESEKDTKASYQQLKAYPNPNDGIFTIEYNVQSVGNHILQMVNATGQLVYEDTVLLAKKSGRLDMSLTTIGSGVYFIKLISKVTGENQLLAVSIL